MKGLKGRFLKKLSLFPTISTLKQSLVLQLHPPVYIPPEVGEERIIISQHVEDSKNQERVDLELKMSKQSSSSDAESDDLPFLDALEETESEAEAEPEVEGSESVILYTTSLRGIRKTYEDCNTVRFLLESEGVMFRERDVSMHLEFREELRRALGACRVVPPKLFIRGRYIGGAEEVLTLHDQGKLKELLKGLPLDPSNGPCSGCGNMRFVVCPNCHGSCKIDFTRCPECNENGLTQCPICS